MSDMAKVRTIERTEPDGSKTFVIQGRHFFLFMRGHCHNSFATLPEAQQMLCFFDGTKASEKVVFEESKRAVHEEQ